MKFEIELPTIILNVHSVNRAIENEHDYRTDAKEEHKTYSAQILAYFAFLYCSLNIKKEHTLAKRFAVVKRNVLAGFPNPHPDLKVSALTPEEVTQRRRHDKVKKELERKLKNVLDLNYDFRCYVTPTTGTTEKEALEYWLNVAESTMKPANAYAAEIKRAKKEADEKKALEDAHQLANDLAELARFRAQNVA